jgi:hypothetical protein
MTGWSTILDCVANCHAARAARAKSFEDPAGISQVWVLPPHAAHVYMRLV